jgi:peptidoglycan-associated lipoprotein
LISKTPLEILKGGKMQRKLWTVLALLLVIPGLLFTASCAKQTVKSEPAVTEVSGQQPSGEAAAPASGAMMTAEELAAYKAKTQFVNEDVYFAYDSSELDGRSRQVLKRKAGYMAANLGVKVFVEGHCDDRGTNEYNLALGERRAESAKSFLVDLGIGENRLTTISYGEERPVDLRSNEEAWAKNRRAHFVIE